MAAGVFLDCIEYLKSSEFDEFACRTLCRIRKIEEGLFPGLPTGLRLLPVLYGDEIKIE